jgi:hypothetical protein
MTKPKTRQSVGSIALSLARCWEYDWDVAYAAAYAYKWGVASPRTYAQAIAAMERSYHIKLTNDDVRAIHAAYLKVKVGTP